MQAFLLLLALLAALGAAELAASWDATHVAERFVPSVSEHTPRARTTPSSFAITYDSNTPATVKSVVDYVLNLIDSWLELPQSLPIRVSFHWTKLTTGMLGNARPYWTSDGNNMVQALYLVRNQSYYAFGSGFEIYAQFSNSINWYIGTDGQLQHSQYDFATVFLHEMMHGLGFGGEYALPTGSAQPPTALYNYNQPNESSSVFDARLYYTIPEPDVALSAFAANNAKQKDLLNAATSSALVFRTLNNGDVKLYAPSTFVDGSSIYHLDPTAYSGSNSLMRPSLNNGDAFHYAGLPTLYVLQTLGYALKAAAYNPPQVTTNPPPTSKPPTASLKPDDGDAQGKDGSTEAPTREPTIAPLTAAWQGSYNMDSSSCNTATCCCPHGAADITYDAAANSVTINTPVTGVCSSSTVSIRFPLYADDNQAGTFGWEGATYYATISGAPAVVSIRPSSGSCGGARATCTSGACLSLVSAGSTSSTSSAASVSASLALAALATLLLL